MVTDGKLVLASALSPLAHWELASLCFVLLVQQRDWDEFKDDNPRGWGNSKLRPCG
jgi:hypothetical protein